MAAATKKIPMILIILSGLAFGIFALTSMRLKSPVRDEAVHWAFGRDVLQRKTGGIPQRGVGAVSALNVLVGGEKVSGVKDAAMLYRGRIPTVIIGMLLVLTVGWFAWKLFGPEAGALAAILAAFEPNLIAHSRWVTTDIPVSFGILLTVFAAWSFSQNPGWLRSIGVGSALGLTLLAKSSGLLLIPVLVVFWFSRFSQTTPENSFGRWTRSASFILMLLVAVFIVNAGFAFAGSFTPLQDYRFHSRFFHWIVKHLPGAVCIPLPQMFVRCLDASFRFTELGHPTAAFLNGHFSKTGFPLYYFFAFMFKSTLGFIIITLTALGFSFRKETRSADLFLYLPAAFFFLYFSLFSKVNIGLRYILPVYPLLCISAARLLRWVKQSHFVTVLVVSSTLTHAAASLKIYPHYLEFFNLLAGGAESGYLHLSDSNLDWGQDIGLLKKYLSSTHKPVRVLPTEPTNGLIAINANRLVSDKYAWLRNYSPIHRIAYTWFVFDVTDLDADLLYASRSFNGDKKITERLRGPKPDTQIADTLKPVMESGALESIANKNVLIITIDTLRADHLGCYGHRLSTTPCLDNLSRKGTLFMETRCQIPRTTPSHSSIFTGLYPGSHGSTMNCQPILPGIRTLADILSQNGYKTGAVVASAVVSGRASGLNKGFSYYNDSTDSVTTRLTSANKPPAPAHEPAFKGKLKFAGGMGEMHTKITPYERKAKDGTDLALVWLRQASDKPFFFWMHYFDPHSNYDPPGVFRHIFDGDYSPRGTVLNILQRKKLGLPIHLEELNHFQGQYDGEIRYVDSQIARLTAYLSASGAMKNTLIIITADHGETLGEYKAYIGHGKHLNEGSIRVPLLFIFPDKRLQAVNPTPVQSIDIMPTILAYLGLPEPPQLQGKNVFDSTGLVDRDTFFIQSAVLGRDTAAASLRAACCDAHYKYICDVRADLGAKLLDKSNLHLENLKTYALYDLINDPMETRDISARFPDKIRDYRQQTFNWLISQDTGLTLENTISDEDRKILKSLGYLQ